MIKIYYKQHKIKKLWKVELFLIILVFSAIFFGYFPAFVKALEDNYEENDNTGSAYDISSNVGHWLSEIDGLGYQGDNDYFEVELTTGLPRLVVFCKFTHSGGSDINIQIVNENQQVQATGNSGTDNEFIDIELTLGTWYIRVYGPNSETPYDLFWDKLIGGGFHAEDNYEDNDVYTDAYDLSSYEDTWLTEIAGLGTEHDYDWYEITVVPTHMRVTIDCLFVDTHSDIDMELFASDGSTYIDSSFTSSDNEHIDVIVPSPGTYYIRVWGEWNNAIYDLKWEELPYLFDDNYEGISGTQHDSPNGYNLVPYKNDWLSTIFGLGIQSDDDWYEIFIGAPYLRVMVDCTFTDADGNIDLSLYNPFLQLVTTSSSTTNNENIDIIVPSPGYYKLRIFGDNSMNTYNLRWNSVTPPDDNYEGTSGTQHDSHPGFNLMSYENTWLSAIDGLGRQIDDDWYQIYVDQAKRKLQVECTHTSADGNINLAIYDDTETLIIQNTSITDNEYINCILPSDGSYSIKVYGSNYANTYNLRWNTSTPLEDNYEENDDLSASYNISSDEAVWLSNIDGIGRQLDDDWFEIYISSGIQQLQIECIFTHSLGNINIALYDDTETLIIQNASTTDNEFINYALIGPGTYHILVHGPNNGNEYNLRWSTDLPSDDNYEENDVLGQAHDLSAYNSMWLYDIDGYGRQIDDDWYEILVTSGEPYLTIECTFDHNLGNIDLALYYTNGTLISDSSSTSNNEYINSYYLNSGSYYLKLYGANWANEYNLKWTTEPDQIQPEWIQTPNDQQLEWGTSFSYDVDAEDLSGIKEYQVNDTTNFMSDSNGLIENKTFLDIGIYWLTIKAIDYHDNEISAEIRVVVHAIELNVLIIVNATTIQQGEYISFSCQVSDQLPPCNFNWNFKDGQDSSLESIIHQFNNAGTYNVTLEVTDQYDVSGSHNVIIIVESDSDSDSETPFIPGYDLILLLSILSITSLLIVYKKKLNFK